MDTIEDLAWQVEILEDRISDTKQRIRDLHSRSLGLNWTAAKILYEVLTIIEDL